MKLRDTLRDLKQRRLLIAQERRARDFRLTYMEASLGLWLLALLLFSFVLFRSVFSAGHLTRLEGILGFACLPLCLAGFVLPLYGHFVVRLKTHIHWVVGVALNGISMLLLFFIYGIGLVSN